METILLYAIFIGIQVVIFQVFKWFRKLSDKIGEATLEQYIRQIMTQYDTTNSIISMFEKDDEASKKSKQVRYQIGEILKTLRRYIDTIKNEKMTDEEKVESIKLYISQKLKEYIQKYEDEHGDVIDDDTVIRISEYILNFIQPMLYKEISKV